LSGDTEDGRGLSGSLEALAASGDLQRMNAILRFLFAAVIIDKHHGTPGTFDYSPVTTVCEG
jgi:hypothetical protein